MKQKLVIPVSIIRKYFVPSAITLPSVAFASNLFDTTEHAFVTIVTWLIPIWILVATLVFFWGVAKYITSLFEKSEAQKRSGMSLMIWSIVALIAAFALWGFSGPPVYGGGFVK
ncbi:MAG TPA: hypothetical protein VLB83_04420 [Candidatus Paceibacterota bacterium]|nr:hypothetical protein [Candidatus Paceibacterota bacterium]